MTSTCEAPHCPTCGQLVVTDERGMIKVHFATVADTRPCLASWCDLTKLLAAQGATK